MVVQLSVELDQFDQPDQPFDQHSQFAPLALNLEASAPLAQSQPRPRSECIQLDFAELPSLTPVHSQYQALGVEFSDAIALQPSNPAFADPSYSVGLMPFCNQTLTVYFHQPCQIIRAKLTADQQITIRAFDQGNRLVCQQQIGQPHYADRQTAPAQHPMQLQAREIARVEIASDAPFLMHQFGCG